jgi:3-methyladenine DNA glycosylase/8-oxoguanine DNA glycosylase
MKDIGRRAVERSLVFNLGRLDVLPAHDLAVAGFFGLRNERAKYECRKNWPETGPLWPVASPQAACFLWIAKI